jgi:hypothetical protein
MSRMTYMRSWKSLRLTLQTWLGLNPQIGRPLSRIVVPLVFFYIVYGCDRSSLNSVKNNGRGVIMAVKRKFQSDLISDYCGKWGFC